MNGAAKIILIVLVILYVVSPDLAPGPIDDIIVILLGYATQKRIGMAEE